jgi:shikimate kinase
VNSRVNETDSSARNTLIFLIGASGSGKTVIGERAAERTGWSLYDTDAEILAQTGAMRISDIFDQHGEEYFRQLESETLTQIVEMSSGVLVATGGGMPAIPGVMDRMCDAGVTVYLRARLATLWKRVRADPQTVANRPLLRDNGEEVLGRLLADRQAIYSRAPLILDTDKLSVDEVCELVVTQIGSMQKTAGP